MLHNNKIATPLGGGTFKFTVSDVIIVMAGRATNRPAPASRQTHLSTTLQLQCLSLANVASCTLQPIAVVVVVIIVVVVGASNLFCLPDAKFVTATVFGVRLSLLPPLASTCSCLSPIGSAIRNASFAHFM